MVRPSSAGTGTIWNWHWAWSRSTGVVLLPSCRSNEQWAHVGARDVVLGQRADEGVNVIDVPVHPLESELNRGIARNLGKGDHTRQAVGSAHAVVIRQAVIPAALNVAGN